MSPLYLSPVPEQPECKKSAFDSLLTSLIILQLALLTAIVVRK